MGSPPEAQTRLSELNGPKSRQEPTDGTAQYTLACAAWVRWRAQILVKLAEVSAAERLLPSSVSRSGVGITVIPRGASMC